MFHSNYGTNPNQDPSRPPFSHSHTSPPGFGQPFTVAGMSNPVGSPSLRGGPLSGTSGLNVSGMGDSQSRSHYQPGYLMSSMSQSPTGSPQHQRHDDVPIVQTKATLNNILASASASDFGMGSMFESSRERQRQTLADEDAPPTASLDDIINEVRMESPPKRQPAFNFNASARTSFFRPTESQVPSAPKPATAAPAQEPIQVVVFGYPPDKYSATAEYFKSLGDSTEPEQNHEVMNCFKIGYKNPTDALRAVRKNGELIGGQWMVGAKWADPVQAETILGPSLARSSLSFSESPSADAMAPASPPSAPPPNNLSASTSFASDPNLALTLQTGGNGPPNVGTPIRLAPSAAAFRRDGHPSTARQPKPGEGGFAGFPARQQGTPQATAIAQQSPSKGVLGQVSDLIFGW